MSEAKFADTVYFFGCLQGIDEDHTEAGHYWRSSDGSQTRDIPQPFGRYPDGKLAPEGPQAQGAAILHQKEGWSAIGFWDRTGDSRGNSNSNFIVHGTYDFDEMCKLAKDAYPLLWKRIGSVRHAGTNIPEIQGFVVKGAEIKLHGHAVDTTSVEAATESIAKVLGIQFRRA